MARSDFEWTEDEPDMPYRAQPATTGQCPHYYDDVAKCPVCTPRYDLSPEEAQRKAAERMRKGPGKKRLVAESNDKIRKPKGKRGH